MRATALFLLLALSIPTPAAARSEKPGARASRFCQLLEEYLAGAPKEFASLRGEKDPIEPEYDVKERLPGAAYCTVFARVPGDDLSEAFLSCDMEEAKDKPKAIVIFDALVTKVRACLPEDGWASERANKEDGGLYVEFHRTGTDDLAPFVEVDADETKDGTWMITVDVIKPAP